MENRNKKESEERNMKLKKAVVVLMAVGLCMLTGCSNQSYVGKWTTTKLQGMEKEEKDFQKENGYQMILSLNANGSYDVEYIAKKKSEEEECKKKNDDFKKQVKNPKWKVVDGYGGGIVLWNGKQKEPEKNSKAQYYTKDGRLLQHESTWIFER